LPALWASFSSGSCDRQFQARVPLIPLLLVPPDAAGDMSPRHRVVEARAQLLDVPVETVLAQYRVKGLVDGWPADRIWWYATNSPSCVSPFFPIAMHPMSHGQDRRVDLFRLLGSLGADSTAG
jgi:hypothetical protein